MAALENPANTPISARNAKNCQTFAATPISAVNTPIARLERTSISLRPRRAATRPHTGDAKAATKDVTPLRMPAHRFDRARLLDPELGQQQRHDRAQHRE